MSTNLIVYFVEGILQFAMDRGQLLKVSVGLVNGTKDFVDFIYGLVHGSLEERQNLQSTFNNPMKKCGAGLDTSLIHLIPNLDALSFHDCGGSDVTWALTMLKDADACSRSPTRPDSLKYFPEQMPSSSGDRMSSDRRLLQHIGRNTLWNAIEVSTIHNIYHRYYQKLQNNNKRNRKVSSENVFYIFNIFHSICKKYYLLIRKC